VMESSTGGCNGRVCRNVYPLASLLARGYKPVRFRALQDQMVASAAAPDGGKSAGSKDAIHKADADSEAPHERHQKKHRREVAR